MSDKEKFDIEALHHAVIERMDESSSAIEAWRFMDEVLSGLVVENFYINLAPEGYEELKPTSQVVAVASGLFFDFVFSDKLQRYDVSRVQGIQRIEERHEEEESVEGPPRRKVYFSVEWGDQIGNLSLTIVAYGERGRELAEFARWLRRRVYGGA